MAFLPLFIHSVLSADNDAEETALDNRLSAFNWCNTSDWGIFPFVGNGGSATGRAHLWGMYSGIAISILPKGVFDGLNISARLRLIAGGSASTNRTGN